MRPEPIVVADLGIASQDSEWTNIISFAEFDRRRDLGRWMNFIH